MKYIKKIFSQPFFRHLSIIVGMFFSFFVLDVSLRYFSNQYVGILEWYRFAPNLFTASWILLIISILYLLPKKARMICYGIFIFFSNLLVYAEYLHFNILKRFFSFSDFFLIKEGSDYFQYALSQTTIKILFILACSFVLSLFTLWLMKNTREIQKDVYYYIYLILISVILVGGLKSSAYFSLGIKVDSLTWEAAYNPKNIYQDFNNQNKSLEVSGIYEFLFRSAYLYFKDSLSLDKEQLRTELDSFFSSFPKEKELLENSYSNLFQGKNVILILLESIDSWLVTEEVMPTLTYLENTGFNFTNRYAPSFGGGQTINSEFAMNTGLYSIENGKAIYNYDKNTYTQSLPSLLKKNGYSAISIHTNSGNFYNRTLFHQALGYDTHYALDDIYTINHKDYNYYNDSDLIRNDETYYDIVREEPFLSFIITYSAHVPYDSTNDRCVTNPYHLAVEGNEELSCIRNLAKETDEMLRLLIERLKEDNLLDDTVLVLATDHYSYGYGDKATITNYKKTTSEYLLQKVPFVIWNPTISHQDIDILMDTADILPTLLNMLGISYNPEYYMGTDVFSKNHEKFIYFSKDVFYDGKVLYDASMKNIEDQEYVSNILKIIQEKIERNDKLIVSDYFRDK